MGQEPEDDEPDVLQELCYDENSPISFLAALGSARESARRARETVSTEVWESINTTWLAVRGGRLQRMRPAVACSSSSGSAAPSSPAWPTAR